MCHFCQLYRCFGYLRDSDGTTWLYAGNWIKPTANIIRGRWSRSPVTAVFRMSQLVIVVRAAVEAVKCSLNLHVLFKNSNILHIGYMQQKRKKYVINLTFVFRKVVLWSVYWKRTNTWRMLCYMCLYARGQNLILYAYSSGMLLIKGKQQNTVWRVLAISDNMTQWALNYLCVSLIFHGYATVSKLEKIDLMSCKPYRVCSSLLSLYNIVC